MKKLIHTWFASLLLVGLSFGLSAAPQVSIEVIAEKDRQIADLKAQLDQAPELQDEMTWLAFDREGLRAHFASIPEHVWPLGETTRIVSVGAIELGTSEANTLATFCILRNDSDGRTECYAVGRYRDRWCPMGEGWKLAERLVELRTRLLPVPAPIPL